MFFTLISKALQIEASHRFETVDSLTLEAAKETEVSTYFEGFHWLENKVTSKMVNLNEIYQEKAFSRNQ